MIGETGANVNKIIVLGDKDFVNDIGDELFNKLDVRTTKVNMDNPIDPHLLLRHIKKCEIVIVSLDRFTSASIASAGMARALDKVVVGVGMPDLDPEGKLLTYLCDFGCAHEDVVSEVNKYL